MAVCWDRFCKKLRVKGKNNFISYTGKLNGKIRVVGNDNQIVLKSPTDNIKIVMFGSHNKIIVETGALIHNVLFYIGKSECPVQNCLIIIGSGTTSGKVEYRLHENDSQIKVGEDCMFASNICVWCTDVHSILSENGEVINQGHSIEIGNHVWIGTDVKIGKNVKIPDNSVVGWNSVVTKKFEEPGVVIAGNPAVVVKQKISWRRECPQSLLNMAAKIS